ncbi:hypothetical protein DF3PB_40006 [uncultured Defluviicoccus sp.]|uniref:Uncharacterized protein n=1 Tax=metagenome TaxID=256318 RepID=A0A380THN5_9ZZZZ|nr:hypothetical protein DF3PB_40006 [uncultured Defluviicoccus sp.]
MNSTDSKLDRDNKAVEALIAASLHQDEGPVEPTVVAKYMKGDFVLTPEEEKSLETHGRNFTVKGGTNIAGVAHPAILESADVMALHRKKPRGSFSIQTEAELDRKRRELRERLRRNKDKK